MGFGEQMTQLMLIILALGLAYGGIMFWTKRTGNGGGGGILGPGGPAIQPPDLEDVAGTPPGTAGGGPGGVPGELGDAISDRVDGQTKAAERVQALTGRDAEAAARVLKRMLKQDEVYEKRKNEE